MEFGQIFWKIMYREIIKLLGRLVGAGLWVWRCCELIIFGVYFLGFLGDEDAGFALEVGEEGEVLVAEGG